MKDRFHIFSRRCFAKKQHPAFLTQQHKTAKFLNSFAKGWKWICGKQVGLMQFEEM